MSAPATIPDPSALLAGIRAALNEGYVVRLSRPQLADFVAELRRLGIIEPVWRSGSRELIAAFDLSRVGLIWDAETSDFLSHLIPQNPLISGELGGLAVIGLSIGDDGQITRTEPGTMYSEIVTTHRTP
jgi:hypothetical protein